MLFIVFHEHAPQSKVLPKCSLKKYQVLLELFIEMLLEALLEVLLARLLKSTPSIAP